MISVIEVMVGILTNMLDLVLFTSCTTEVGVRGLPEFIILNAGD